MAQKNLLHSAGDGTAIPVGAIGEKISALGLVVPGAISNTAVTNVSITGTLQLSQGSYIIFFGAELRSDGRHASTTDYQRGGNIVLNLFDGTNDVDFVRLTTLVPAAPSVGPGGSTLYMATHVNVGSGGKTYSLRYSTTVDGAVTMLYRSISLIQLHAIRIS